MNAAALLGDPAWLSSNSVLVLGLLFGVRHALDADHVAAVSTIAVERGSVLSSSVVGLLWGAGHAVALAVAAAGVILFQVRIGAGAARILELMVAAMLVALGGNALRSAWFGVEPTEPRGLAAPSTVNWRPALVGMVHGLAGSAALSLLLLSTMVSRAEQFGYVAAFAAGSMTGMALMSALVGVPARLTAARSARLHRALRLAVGVIGVCIGVMLAYEVGAGGAAL